MFSLATLIPYLGACAVLAIVPGPTVTVILANALRSGTLAGLSIIAGTQLGLVTMILVVALGLEAVMGFMAFAFDWIKLAGAAYLVYLGVQSLRSVRRGEERLEAPKPVGSPFRQGLVTNLLNPKLAVLFTTLLPQFIAQGDPAAKSALLAAVFLAIGLTWLVIYTLIVGVVARSRRFRVITEAITGVVLIALGARLALER